MENNPDNPDTQKQPLQDVQDTTWGIPLLKDKKPLLDPSIDLQIDSSGFQANVSIKVPL